MTQQLYRQFLADCGASTPLNLSVTEWADAAPREVQMERPYALIGRHPQSHIHSDNAGVSKRHAYLQVLGGRLFCVDLGSRTGVRCANRPFTYGWFPNDAAVQIDSLEIHQQSSEEPVAAPWMENPLEQRVDGPGAFPPLRATVYENGEVRGEWHMRQVLVIIGRGPLARLQLRDPSVSRYHCSLVGTPAGVWVVDLLSSKGSTLNGVPFECARIGDGDRLAVGKFELQFMVPSGVSATVPRERPAGGALVQRASSSVVPAQSDNLVAVLQQFAAFQENMLDQFQQSMLMMLKMFTTTHNDQMESIRKELSRLQEVQLELLALRQQQAPLQETARTSAPTAPQIAAGTSAASPPRTDAPPSARPTTAASNGKPPRPDMHMLLAQRIAGLEKERETVWKRVLGFVLGKNG